jgi:hypothetical protein
MQENPATKFTAAADETNTVLLGVQLIEQGLQHCGFKFQYQTTLSRVCDTTYLPSTSCSFGGLLVWLTVTPNLSGNSASKRATSWERPTADAADSTTRRGGARCGFDRLTRQQLAMAGRPCARSSK